MKVLMTMDDLCCVQFVTIFPFIIYTYISALCLQKKHLCSHMYPYLLTAL